MQPGTKLGSYEISDLLGKGGMGEVYRARDTKLGREVAIKVLPAEFARDAERLARLEREARMLAALNHPNIAAIHGLEESDETRFLVLELVEGDTLADRLKRGAIPVEESLKLALQIAEALEAAHEKGVIHRDLKPANIKITPEGRVKVLDFGLAKAFIGDQADVNLSNSPTLSMAATQAGIVLGTAAYMSPEQASGEVADHRADVWAFGVVLFEMLTGRPLFTGKTAAHVMGAVLNIDPDWSALPANLHPRIRMVLERLLEKEAKDRLSGISDARVEIQKVRADPSGLMAHGASAPERARYAKIAWVAAFVAGVALTALGFMFLLPPPEPRAVRRLPLVLPSSQTLPQGSDELVAISPDGQTLVYRASELGSGVRLYRRNLDQFDATPIIGSEGAGASAPFFSSDGDWLAFTIGTTLMKVELAGGRPLRIADLPGQPRGGSWTSDDDMIVLGMRQSGLLSVPGSGGDVGPVIVPDDGREYWHPQVVAEGRAILFTASLAQPDGGDVMLLETATGEVRTLVDRAVAGRYLPSGHLVFLREGNLWAVAFDLGQLQVVSDPVVIEQGVRVEGGGAVQVSVAPDGTLVFVPGGASAQTNAVGLVDRNGTMRLLDLPPNRYVAPRFSPDGTSLAVQTDHADGSDIWIYDLSGDTQIRQLTQGGTNLRPLFTPDSRRVTFGSGREGTQGIFWQLADGSGAAERLTTAESGEHWPESWSPDGGTLSFSDIGEGGRGIWTVSVESGESELFFDSPGTDYASVFSPGGDWLAYWSSESGTNEVYVQPFPAVLGVKHRITQNSGAMPLWSPDGAELFYRPSPAGVPVLNRIGIETEPAFNFTGEQPMPIDDFLPIGNYRSYDISPDGDTFVMLFPAGTADAEELPRAQINIVLNWFEELRERVPVP